MNELDNQDPGSPEEDLEGLDREEDEGSSDEDVEGSSGEEVEDSSAEDLKLYPAAPLRAEAPAQMDTLRRYLQEVGKYGLLSREEEVALAIRVREKQDQEAAYRLVTSNLRLVIKIALDFHRYWMRNLLDLIQEGNVGLMQAVAKFNPYRGVKFSYYASFWIKAYILKHILDNWHLVRVGTTQSQRKLFFNLKREKERLLSQGLDPSPKLLAEKLNVTEKDVTEMDGRLEGWAVSLDSPIQEDSKESFTSLLADEGPELDEILANQEIRELLHQKLAEFRQTLKKRDLEILDRRILTDKPLTLEDLGRKYGISRERVRQLEHRIKGNIRRYLTEEIAELDGIDFLETIGQED